MASGPIVGDEGVREIQRYSESKVYTRKAFRGTKNKGNTLNVVPLHNSSSAATITTTASTTVTAVNSTVENSVDGTKDNGNNILVQSPARISAPEGGDSALPVVVSEDSSSLNRRQDEHFTLNVQLEEACGLIEPSLRNCVGKQGLENGVKIGIGSRSKRETREHKRKLVSELEKVRSLVNRIEEKQAMVGGYGGNLNMSVDRHRVDNGGGAKRSHSEVASAGVSREATRPMRQISLMVLENSQGISENIEKEKRTPKANQFYCNSEFLLAKDKFPPAESNKKSKSNGKKHGGREMGHGVGIGLKYLKSCSSLLEKLMKHKHCWVFNTPVDVEGLGLHDYYIIISHPMDLGTVKSRLNKNWYKSPKEFAEDVRLTFRNAMTYNPRGQDVHIMAEELSTLFEERWAIVESNYNHEMRYGMDYGQAIPSPLSRKTPGFRPPPLDMRRILDKSESMTRQKSILSSERREMAASGIAGAGLTLNCFSTSTTRCRTRTRFRSRTMAVSTDQKPQTDKLILRKSEEAFAAAKELMPGGVNSPVRAFKSVGGQPIIIDSVKGSRMWDIDGNQYIDYVGSWGPAIIGHADDKVLAALAETMKKGTSFGAPCLLENTLAEMVISAVPSIEMVRFVNSGTEACMGALRLARAYTGKEKIIKFEGCYHGHADPFLVKAGSGVATLGLPDSPGVPKAATFETLTAPFNDFSAVEELFEANKGEIAVVFLEAVVGNSGFITPKPDFLSSLRKITKENNALLVFDEVMTGFRLSYGGAQEYFGVTPDITTLGKIIGGGLPVGAYGGRRDIMETVAPAGPMYQAGTLSGNPLAMTAGIETLKRIKEPGTYEYLDKITGELVQGIVEAGKRAGHAICGGHINGMFGFFFTEGPVYNFTDAKKSDTAKFARFFWGMLAEGVYLAPSQFEAGFTSLAHTSDDIKKTIAAAEKVFREI